MPEYAKLKNVELEALLKERGLPTTGKKADMVDRLTKDDEKKSAPATNAEDEIDWDDEDETAAPTAKVNAPVTSNEATIEEAGAKDQTQDPQAVPSQVAETGPAPTGDGAVQSPAKGDEAKTEEKKEPAPDFTKGLAPTDLDEEIQRRRKRAEKFGMKVDEDEGLKKLERAKKFGESAPPRGLDEALPERGPRKRTREGGDDAGDNKRRGGGRQGGQGGRGGRDRRDNRNNRDNRDNRNRGEREPRKEQARSNGGNFTMSEKDRAAAEARKAKWVKSTAS